MTAAFTLASGRSGTRFLCSLLRRNARGCVVVHEPYLRPGNPNMFGLPIYDHAEGRLEPIRALLRRKAARIRRFAPRAYIETSHAFLKSWSDLAPEFFPELRVIRLIRNPLAVARSEANREELIHRYRLPFRNYRGRDGKKYFRWSLTGREPVFEPFPRAEWSAFQWYLIQWIEIENRAERFLERLGGKSRCFTMHAPDDLNDPGRLRELLRFLDLEAKTAPPVLSGVRNRNPGRPTVVGAREIEECRRVVDRIDGAHLEIFAGEPYAGRTWREWLVKGADAGEGP